ncbi:MAG: glycerophosphoryl diester phosphodiesterase membrane domain-containing protein [Allosphingosinicella sp.]
MANLSITTAWNETAAFVTREGRLLFPIAFLLVALPGVVLQAAMPTPVPGQPVEPGPWLLLLPVALVSTLIGMLALAFLALRPGSSVAEALQAGGRRFLPVFAATLLVALAALVLALPLLFLIRAQASGVSNPALGPIGGLLVIALVVAYVFVWVRLMLMTPVGANENLGPVAIVTRSWELTRGHFWRLLGFVLLLGLAALVVMFAISLIAGVLIFLLAGPPEPDGLSFYLLLVLAALMQSVFSTLFVTLVSRIYAQLASAGTPNVFA